MYEYIDNRDITGLAINLQNDKKEEEEDDYTGICKISPSSSSNSYALSWKKYKWMEMNPLKQTPIDTIHGE